MGCTLAGKIAYRYAGGKFWSMSHEWQIIINTWSNLEYIDRYGHDNHLELYKIIVNH